VAARITATLAVAGECFFRRLRAKFPFYSLTPGLKSSESAGNHASPDGLTRGTAIASPPPRRNNFNLKEIIMLKRLWTAALIGGAAITIACGGGTQSASTVSAPADPAPINELRAKYQSAYNAGDAAALAALFTDDAVSLPDHHAALTGKAAIQGYFEELFKEYAATIAITPGDTEMTGNLAHEHGAFTIKVTPKINGDTVVDDGKYIVILKRGADGAWKIHHDMDNSVRMPPMPRQNVPPAKK
jgi:uncharacterized protein (TIGR02246 family)